jgi:hypothetical protein
MAKARKRRSPRNGFLFPDAPIKKRARYTKAFQLTPTSIVAAAVKDLTTRELNVSDSGRRWYSFHRKHVVKATTPSELVTLALKDRKRGIVSSKPNTRAIYQDEELLKAAASLPPPSTPPEP